jgi:ABC-type glycerol-3-phosphate transport system permease component
VFYSLRSERIYNYQPYSILIMGFIAFGWVASWFIGRCTTEAVVSGNVALAGAGALLMVFQAALTRPQLGEGAITITDGGFRRLTITERFSRWTEKQTGGRIASSSLLYFTIGLAAFVAMVPFLWMISNSLMTLGEALTRSALPQDAIGGLCNYVEAWEEAEFSQYFVNSVIITFVTITGLLATSILAAYAFARIEFVGRNTVFTLLLITLMIPESVTLVPNYLIITGFIPIIPSGMEDPPFITLSASWLNTLTALTMPFMASAFAIFLLRQFFATIPHELWEACRIDGGGHFRFLLQIVLPISRAPILTVTLLTFVAAWNAFLWPLIVTTNETWRPLMVGLYNFTQEGGTEIHLLMAGSFITILPMLMLYFLTQKAFTEGIATSGLKG